MLWLGIETSCDETAVAVVRWTLSGLEVLASQVSSQIREHRPFGGVVPELAVREHLRHLPAMVPAVLEAAGLGLRDLEGVAVTEGPGLAACLLIGHSYARGLGVTLSIPVAGINHLEGHLLSPFLDQPTGHLFPFVGLVVSGGHTQLILSRALGDYQKLGGTVDDAAGEAFDKVARLLGLPYPGGPEIEKAARSGNPRAIDFPQSFPERENFNFSFSGLKTSVRYFLEKRASSCADPKFVADVCASFQEAVVQVLARKAILAAQTHQCGVLSISGGVAQNGRLRAVLVEAARTSGLQCRLAGNALCTDNAVMIAAVAAWKQAQGSSLQLGSDINPNLAV